MSFIGSILLSHFKKRDHFIGLLDAVAEVCCGMNGVDWFGQRASPRQNLQATTDAGEEGVLRIAVQARGAISVHARCAAQISAPSFPIRALWALKGQTANVPAYREVFR